MLGGGGEITCTRELRYKRESACNQDNCLRVKRKYQFVVRLKAIEYKEDILYYLSSYIRLPDFTPDFYLVLVPQPIHLVGQWLVSDISFCFLVFRCEQSKT